MLPWYRGNQKPGLEVRPGFAIDQLIVCGRKGLPSDVLVKSPAGVIYAEFMHGMWKREYNGFGPAWHFLMFLPILLLHHVGPPFFSPCVDRGCFFLSEDR
jgi:hypothetical protein